MNKAYSLPIDYVLYDISYVNMMMYISVLPSYDSDKGKDKKAKKDKVIKADDPKNKAEVRKFFENVR